MATQEHNPPIGFRADGARERSAHDVLDGLQLDGLHDVGERLKANKQEQARLSAKTNVLLKAGREAKLTCDALAHEMGLTRASIFKRAGGKQGLRGTSHPKKTSAATAAKQAEVKAQLQALRTDIEDSRRQGEWLNIEANGLIGAAYGLGLTCRQVGAAMGFSNVSVYRRGGKRGLNPTSSGPDRPRNPAEAWKWAYAAYCDYLAANGAHPKSEGEWKGWKVGQWASRQRTSRRLGDLDEARAAKLEAIGFAWDARPAMRQRFIDAYCSFVEDNGRPPENHERWEGINVGNWAISQRKARRKGKLTGEVIGELDKVGFFWESAKEIKWRMSFDAYMRFVELEGREPTLGDVQDGILVGAWINSQRRNLKEGVLKNEDYVRELEAIGFERGAGGRRSHAKRWDDALDAYSSFVKIHGRPPLRRESWAGVNVGRWAHTQRQARKEFKGMDAERIRKLDEIGFVW